MLKNFRYKKEFIAIFLLAISIGFIRSTFQMLKSNKRLTDLEDEVTRLENEEKALREQIEYKNTEEYIEERARNDLNLIKPGEEVYVVVGEGYINNKNVLSVSSKIEEKKKFMDTNWYMWYRLFF